ncbi:PAS domain S-box protein, partial [Spirulina sp. 06S082]|uniref:PAS domain S-box protein n=1 Tax=Spirulina sp. 06S082 TaxID=3110248 RepID=UPI002B1F2CBB
MLEKTIAQKSIKLLLLESQSKFNNPIARWLDESRDEIHLTRVENAAIAMTRMKQETFDLVLLALFSGDREENIKAIAQCFPLNVEENNPVEDIEDRYSPNFHFSQPPLILLSDRDDPELARLALRAGVQDFLVLEDLNRRQFLRTLRHTTLRHSINTQKQCDRCPIETNWKCTDPILKAIAEPIFVKNKENQSIARSSEAFLNHILNTTPDPIFVKDEQHRWILINDAFCHLMGQPRSQLIGKSDYDFFPPEEADVFWEKDALVFETGQDNENEEFLTDVEGIQHTISTKKSIFTHPDGKKTLVGCIRDITQQKQQEAIGQKRQRYLAALVAIQQKLLDCQNPCSCYDDILHILGTTSGASRVYLFENDRDERQGLRMSQKAEWCAEGINPEINNPIYQNLPYKDFSLEFAEILGRGETISDLVTNLSSPMQEILSEQGILSILVLPLQVNGIFFGFIGFDNCIEGKIWDVSEISLLQSVAVSISSTQQRLQTEVALKESEERYRCIVETANEGIVIIDRQGCIDFANHRAANTIGYDPKDIIGKSYTRFINAEMREMFAQVLQQPQTVGSEQYDLQLTHRSGESVWVMTSISPLWQNGQFIGSLGMMTDITQRKKAEADRDRFFTLSADMLCIAGIDGYFKRINPSWSKILGHSHATLLAQPYLEFVHPDDRDLTLAEAQTLGKGGVLSVNFQNRYRCANGDYKWLAWSATSYLEEGFIYAVARDITPEKESQAALQESTQRLAEAQKVTHVGDWEIDLISGRVTWSDELFRIYGLENKKQDNLSAREFISSSTLIGQEYLQYIHPDDRAASQEAMQRAISTGQPYELEQRIQRPNGEIHYLLLRGQPVTNETGQVIRLFGTALDISDRKQLEEEIAQQKRFLNAIIDYIPMGVFVKDVKDEMRYVIWNQFSERNLGVPRADLLGRNNWEVFPEELAHSWQEEDRELLRVKQAIVYPEQEIDNPERQIQMWLQTTKAPIADEFGEITHILGIFNDISERRRAEIALRKSEKKYRDLVETSQDIIWSMDLDGCYTFVNPAMTRICGYEPEEIINRPFWDFIPLYQRRVNTPQFLRVLQGKPLIQHEQKYLAKGDRWIYLQVNAIAVYDESGQVIGVTGTATDITERKRVEEALRESVDREVAIATIIERMRRTLEIETIFSTTTQELRRVLNCDRVIIYRFNPDWSGEVVAEAVGEEWISLLDQDRDRFAMTTASDDCVIKLLYETITIEDTHLKKTQGGGYRRGTRYICIEDIYTEKFAPCYLKLLEKFQARAYLTVPIFTSVQENENENEKSQTAPKLWGLLASYQNSAPRHWQEEEINMAIQIGTQMGIALQQAELLEKTQQQSEALKIAKETADAGNRAKSEFLASMSHELRTPLNAILGFTQLMVRDDRLDREHQENLNIINRSGEHLLALINDVLEMSKIEAGRATFNEDDFNLYRLLDSVEDMLRMKANGKGLQLICDRDRDLPQFVSTDAQKLRQVLINLLSNAIKFTDTGFVTLRVNKRREKQKLYFEVEDTGCGIASEDVEKIFEAFGQTKDGAKSSEGTGLGLPISQQFVRLMGGELDLESERGRGSKFFFEIPINMSSEHILESSISSQKKLRAIVSPDFPDVPYRFLIVEDREYNRLLLLNLLTSLGFEVETANNGVEAIAMWESWQPHFIWMDIQMPIMDGYEATRQIRLQEEKLGNEKDLDLFDRVPIVALTASAFLEDRAK